MLLAPILKAVSLGDHEGRLIMISRSALAAERNVNSLLLFPLASISRTLGSAIIPGVCTCTIFCTNLMAHMRTPIAAVSHLLRMFDLIEAI